MLDHTGPGLVLRRTRHMEQDMRLTIFFREVGRVLVLAKGGFKASNRLKALQDPMTEADFHVALAPHGVHGRLIGGRLTASPHLLSKNWDAFSLASKCCEAVDVLLPFRAPSPDVFDILQGTLQRLASRSNPVQHWIQFNLRFLNALGYGDLSHDVVRLLQPGESEKSWDQVSASSLNRCRSFLEARLNSLLTRPLKSDLLEEDEAHV